MGFDGAFLQRESVRHSNKPSDQLLTAPLIKPIGLIEPVEPIEAGYLLSALMGWATTAKTGVKNNGTQSDNTENHNAENHNTERHKIKRHNPEILTTRDC